MAKCHVIEKQGADIMFLFIFDNEKTFVRHFVVGVYIPQNSDLIPDDFSPCLPCVQTGGQFEGP